MTEPALTLEEAAAHLGEVVERARSRGESTVLTVDGKAVAKVVPVETSNATMANLTDWWRTHERLTAAEADSLAESVAECRRLYNKAPEWHEWE